MRKHHHRENRENREKNEVNTKMKKETNNKLGYIGNDYRYLTPESGYKQLKTIAKNRVQYSVTDECGTRIEKGQVIGNVWLGDECGIRTEIHGDDGYVHYLENLTGAKKID